MQPPTDDPAVAAYVAGEDVPRICARHGISERTLYRRVAAAGVPRRGKTRRSGGGVPVYDGAGRRIADSISEAARRLGLHRNTIAGYKFGFGGAEEYADGLRYAHKERPDA